MSSNTSSITWDDDYNDPASEIVMVSKDNVGFRAGLWKLKKESQLFADLVDTCGTNNLNKEPMRIDHSAPVLRTFLDLVFTSTKQKLNIELEWSACLEILALCDRFQAPGVDKRFLHDLSASSTAPKICWDIFCLANQREDVRLAKAIIPRFDFGDKGNSDDLFYALGKRGMEGISGGWLLGLVRERAHIMKTKNDHYVSVVEWEDVASNFNPK